MESMSMSEPLLYEELSRSIIGAAMTVLNVLKPGLDEKLYERALAIELIKRGHTVQSKKNFLYITMKCISAH